MNKEHILSTSPTVDYLENIFSECCLDSFGTVETDSLIMDLDPMVNLFAFNNSCTSPTCNNSKGVDIKTDRSSTASDSTSEPLYLPQKYSYTTTGHSHTHYNVTSLSNGHSYQTNPTYFSSSSPPSPYYNQTSYSYNNNTNINNNSNSVMHTTANHTTANHPSSNHNNNGNNNNSNNSNNSNNLNNNNNSGVSCAIHPQIHMNANSYPSCHNGNQGYSEYAPHSPSMHFPTASMSVNLSMNMTMGFSGSADPQQVQWGTPMTNNSYQNNYSSQVPSNSVSYLNHMHPSAYSSTSPTSYTITAEFRPTSEHITTLPPIEKEFAGVCSIKPTHSSIYSYHKNMTDSFHHNHPCQNSKSLNRNGSNNNFSQNCDSVVKNMTNLANNNTLSNLCRICGKTYARPSTLKTHLRTHSGERPYRCTTCNKSFSQAANLTAHIRTHSGEKPFKCPTCDRRFSQSSSVTTHMRTHSGERPYCCSTCKKAFSDSSTLTKHTRIHSGEKPYQCKLCMLRFSQSGNLNRHMRIHTNIL